MRSTQGCELIEEATGTATAAFHGGLHHEQVQAKCADGLHQVRVQAILPVIAPEAWLNPGAVVECISLVAEATHRRDCSADVLLCPEGSESRLDTLECVVEGLEGKVAGTVYRENELE